MRYITFVDVIRHTYSHSDAVHDNPDMEFAGWFIAGLTVFTLIPVYVPLLCCADKNDCQITLKGKYNLIVYDTQKKEIVFNSPIEINENDIFRFQSRCLSISPHPDISSPSAEHFCPALGVLFRLS